MTNQVTKNSKNLTHLKNMVDSVQPISSAFDYSRLSYDKIDILPVSVKTSFKSEDGSLEHILLNHKYYDIPSKLYNSSLDEQFLRSSPSPSPTSFISVRLSSFNPSHELRRALGEDKSLPSTKPFVEAIDTSIERVDVDAANDAFVKLHDKVYQPFSLKNKTNETPISQNQQSCLEQLAVQEIGSEKLLVSPDISNIAPQKLESSIMVDLKLQGNIDANYEEKLENVYHTHNTNTIYSISVNKSTSPSKDGLATTVDHNDQTAVESKSMVFLASQNSYFVGESPRPEEVKIVEYTSDYLTDGMNLQNELEQSKEKTALLDTNTTKQAFDSAIDMARAKVIARRKGLQGSYSHTTATAQIETTTNNDSDSDIDIISIERIVEPTVIKVVFSYNNFMKQQTSNIVIISGYF
jgi:hypothetical protein